MVMLTIVLYLSLLGNVALGIFAVWQRGVIKELLEMPL